jgi:DNA modification methylase
MKLAGGQTLFTADARAMKGVADASVDLIITSPPYWNLKDYGGGPSSIGHVPYTDYIEEMNEVWSECYRVAKPGAIMIINVNSRRHQKVFYPIAFDIVAKMKSWTIHDVNVWYIPNALPQPNHYIERLLDNKFEYLLVFIKGGSALP